MDKESIYELQKIDCNCSDCAFMVRDIDAFNNSVIQHHKWQKDYFDVLRGKIRQKANEAKDRHYDLEKWDALHREANKMKFQFEKKECMINFGHCEKIGIPVSFIPNQCQPETQRCFVHRKDVSK